METFWQKLPYHFKQDVVLNLDLMSRCRLQVCSKHDKILVECSPMKMELIYINPSDGKDLNILFKETDTPIRKFSSAKEVVKEILPFAKSRKSLVNKFYLYFNRTSVPFLTELHKEVSAKNLKFKAKYLMLSCTEQASDGVDAILKLFDSTVLKNLILYIGEVKSTSAIEALTRMEHMRNLDRLEIIFNSKQCELNLDEILHINKLVIPVNVFTENDAVKVVKNMIHKNAPIGSYFLILKKRGNFENEKLKLFRKIHEAVKKGELVKIWKKVENQNGLKMAEKSDDTDDGSESESEDEEEISIDEKQMLSRIQMFGMNFGEKVLVIDIIRHKFYGVVCSALDTERDFLSRMEEGLIN